MFANISCLRKQTHKLGKSTSSEYPNCVTYLYVGINYSGYTLHGCGAIAATETVYFDATDTGTGTGFGTTTSTTSSTSSSSSIASSTTTSTSSSAAPTTTSGGGGGGGGHSSTNVGAIVGGVVGGVGAIALAALVGFFIYRKTQKDKANIGSASGAAAAPPQGNYPSPGPKDGGMYGPQGAQQQLYNPQNMGAAGFVPVDNRQSMKPSTYDPSMTNSPPDSPPPPQSHSPPYGGHPISSVSGPPMHDGVSPTSGYGAQQGYYQGYAQPAGEQQHVMYELPTMRPDGELRELSG